MKITTYNFKYTTVTSVIFPQKHTKTTEAEGDGTRFQASAEK